MGLMFLISPVLDVIPLILALLNLNFHLLMLSMLLLEEFPSTHHQIQPNLKPQLQQELHLLLQLNLAHLPLLQQEHLPDLPSAVSSVLAQFSPATWCIISMMMISYSTIKRINLKYL